MRQVFSTSIALVIGFFATSRVYAESSECSMLLTHPVFKKEIINSSTIASNRFRMLQCASSWHDHNDASKAGVDATIPVYGIPVDFSGTYSQSQLDTWKSNNCNKAEEENDYQGTLVKDLYEIDPITARAYIECIAKNQNTEAVSCTTTETQNSVIFEASWRMSNGELATASPVVTGITILGASCSAPLKVDDRIPQGGIGMLCKIVGDEAPAFLLNTSRGKCSSQGSGMSGHIELKGDISLKIPTTYNARSIEMDGTLRLITNGWPLRIQTQNLVIKGSPQILSSEKTEPLAGEFGSSAGTISIKAENITGSGLTITNSGGDGGIGATGDIGSTGSKGDQGAGVSWNPVQGCFGGTNGGAGHSGGVGAKGQKGVQGGSAGEVTIQAPDWGQQDPAIIVRTDVDLANKPRSCGGNICRGVGGPGGKGGPGGNGGPGGDGASGNTTCGGTNGGSQGPTGPQGPQGDKGADGFNANVRRF